MGKKILVADDEREIADLVEACLAGEGFEVHKSYCGEDALDFVRREGCLLAVLDVMLPDKDGFELVKELRKSFVFPIIMLTARSENNDKITGLMLGADDYITKPFSPSELAARVKSQLRRYTRYNADLQNRNEIVIRGLQINSDSHKCFLNDREVILTPTEFGVLWYLCSHKNSVVSGEELFEAVWGEKYLNSSNTEMAHIARIREKLCEPPRRPKYIKTVWGVGYTVEEQQ